MIPKQPSRFSPAEQRILDLLESSKGEVFVRARIEEAIYGKGRRLLSVESNVLEVLIGRIRRKLPKDRVIHTIRNVGYKIEAIPLCDVCNAEPGKVALRAAAGTDTLACANCLIKINPQELQ